MQIILKFLLCAAQIFHICGKVILLRGESYHTNSSVSERKYICLSENDGGALVWNDDLVLRYQQENRTDLQFDSTHVYNTWIHCKIDAETGCLESRDRSNYKVAMFNAWMNCTLINTTISCLDSWNRENWILTDAMRTPMGPVFDQRWEEFRELKFRENEYFTTAGVSIPKTGAMSISIRSWQNVDISVCLRSFTFYIGPSMIKLLCFAITLRYDDTEFTVQYQKSIYLDNSSNQHRTITDTISKKLTSLSETEWRTFVISWDFWKRNISVYDTNNNNRMLTIEDTEKFNFTVDEFDNFYSLFSIQTFRQETKQLTKVLCRFHDYTFLYTVDENAILTTRSYKPNTQKMCIQLSLGLCAECNADVKMIDSTTHKVLHSVRAKGSLNAAIHGLPMWQLVKLDGNFSADTYISEIKIRVIPKITKPTHNPLWAIAHVSQCPNKDVLRKGIISQKNNNATLLSNITCQKLFFNENTVVSSLPKVTNSIDLDTDDKICPEGKIGPDCFFSCEHDLNSSFNCRGTAVCYKHGCLCSPGFQGNTCSDLCNNNWYGYNCTNKCGLCNSFGCNKRTGECINGCADNLKILYVPPLCHIGIDKLTEPEIVSVTSTSIRTKLPIVWKEEYEKIQITYSFTIMEENNYTFSQSWNKLVQNITHLTGYFTNLNPGSVYSIKCKLLAVNEIIESKWQSVETDCEPIKIFTVLSTENSIIIGWQNTSDHLFPCPAHWYYVTLQNKNTGEIISNSTVTTFPHKVSGLPSHTVFNVIVSRPRLAHITIKHSFKFITHIRTLRSASTRVLDIQHFATSSTQVTLKWNSPDYSSIVLYEITLKIILYYGCEDLNLPTPFVAPIKKFTNTPEIIFSDLHPYASYTAQVTVHESQDSSYGAEITFNTNKSDIPTEVFTELKAQNWTLSWQPPKDCSTISGPLNAKIKISGVSTAVKHFSAIEFTSRWYIDLTILNPPLLSNKLYRATVYVIREYNNTQNSSVYQELNFRTPTTAPPIIANLELIEVDTRQVPHILNLRWLVPLSSTKSQVRYYNVTNYCNDYVTSIKMTINKFCNLWDDYVCVNLYKKCSTIQVFEMNNIDTDYHPPASVSQEMFTITKPDKPASVSYTLHDNSIVDLVWYHPWKTSRHLQCFLINVEESTSYLKQRISQSTKEKKYEYSVEEYMRNYTERLHLYPSTVYRIYIRSMTITNETSLYNYVNVQTPSTARFDDVLHDVPDEFSFTILLKVPHVLNDTYDSGMHIIVKGPNRCKNYSKIPQKLLRQVNVKKNDVGWQAAEITTDEIARNNYTFIVGDNKTYGGARNCPLQPNRSYEIIVILKEQRSIFRISNEMTMLKLWTSIGKVSDSSPIYEIWLSIPIILLLIIVVTVFYIYRRRTRQVLEQMMSQNEMEVWQNAEKTTVFSNTVKSR